MIEPRTHAVLSLSSVRGTVGAGVTLVTVLPVQPEPRSSTRMPSLLPSRDAPPSAYPSGPFSAVLALTDRSPPERRLVDVIAVRAR